MGRAVLVLVLSCAPAVAGAQGRATTDGWTVTSAARDIGAVAQALSDSDAEISRCLAASWGPGHDERRARVAVSAAEGWVVEFPRVPLADCVVAALNAAGLPQPVASETYTIVLRTARAPAGDARTDFAGDTPLRLRGPGPLWLRPAPPDEAPLFWRRRAWRSACSECELTLERGGYQLGYGARGGIRAIEPVLDLRGPLDALITVDSREPLRTAGFVTGLTGGLALLAGVLMLIPVAVLEDGGGSTGSFGDGYIAAAAALALGGLAVLVIALPFVLWSDGVSLSVRPL